MLNGTIQFKQGLKKSVQLKNFKIFAVALILVMSYGCSSTSQNHSTQTPSAVLGSEGEPTEIISLPKPSHQAFLDHLKSDCLTLKDDPQFRQEAAQYSSEEIETRVNHYCTCFSDEFSRQFSTKDLDNYLDKNRELPSDILDEIARTCSIHIEN